ncbi:PAS domain-containing protein [Sphingomonas ginkgonis]|uniref:PAS domain-containing protein n=1 Tax=Sphingomonas ginkgonis TaxID=2315330 RepID=A0A3R9WR82_9SPHN|nr:PAS domain-containing protein [Sphingomonas ginkgonis]RST29866.1 PAS domain-containing protein [Sphingomonas ginkgonis]
MSTTIPPDFDDPDLAKKVEQLGTDVIDELPFGVIRLDDEGVVQLFSRSEAKLSGYGSRPALGRRFFLDVAPCMNNDRFVGRIEAARKRGDLDIEFGFVGDFSDRDRELRVRVQPAAAGGYWLFMQREH